MSPAQKLKMATVELVHVCKDPLFEITIPSKIQAYMAVGKPILMAVEGDAADLVIQSGGGVLAEPENAESLAAAAEMLAALAPSDLQTMGLKARSFYYDYLALEIGVARFGILFRQLSSTI